MSAAEIVAALGDLLGPIVDYLRRHPTVRWGLAAALWTVVLFRLFGRGPGHPRSLFSLYDWLVIVVGTLIIFSLQFGTRLPW